MRTKTKAAVLTGTRQIELQELSIPEVNDDSGLLHVELTGVCGVDWPAYLGTFAERFHPPLILGHEIVGRISRIGKRAATRWNVSEGDRVVLEEYAPCGRCEHCLSGFYYLCGGLMMEKMYGFTSLNVAPGLWGGFSEYVYLDPQALLHKISESVPQEVAPLYLAVANGIRWVQGEANVGLGDSVVIMGPGQLGLASVIAARECGASNIIVTGRSNDAKKLALAAELGAQHIIDIDAHEDVVGLVKELTGGKMADAVINVTSSAATAVQQAVELAKMRGIVVMAGNARKAAVGFLPDMVVRKEITMKGVRGRTGRDLKKALQLIESEKYPLRKLATHKFSIEEAERALLTVGGEGEPDHIHVSVVNKFS